MRRALLIGAGLLLLLLIALSLYLPLPLPHVDDVAVTGVELVQNGDIPKQDRDTPERGLDGPFLRLTLTSSHDFQKLAQDWDYTIGWSASPCRDGGLDDKNLMNGYFALDDARGPVSNYYRTRRSSGPGPVFRYHVYLAVRAEANPDLPADERQYAYDLKAHPQDVCFRLSGLQEVDGDGWGFAKFQSDAARIAKDVIAKAVR